MEAFVHNAMMDIHSLQTKKTAQKILYMIETVRNLRKVLNVVYVKSGIILKEIFVFLVIQTPCPV